MLYPIRSPLGSDTKHSERTLRWEKTDLLPNAESHDDLLKCENHISNTLFAHLLWIVSCKLHCFFIPVVLLAAFSFRLSSLHFNFSNFLLTDIPVSTGVTYYLYLGT